MNIFKGLYMGAAFACGAAADICTVTEKVLEVGHYTAKGLRNTADGLDYVTDVGQEACRNGKIICESKMVNLQENAKNCAPTTKEEFIKLEQVLTQKASDEDRKLMDSIREQDIVTSN